MIKNPTTRLYVIYINMYTKIHNNHILFTFLFIIYVFCIILKLKTLEI